MIVYVVIHTSYCESGEQTFVKEVFSSRKKASYYINDNVDELADGLMYEIEHSDNVVFIYNWMVSEEKSLCHKFEIVEYTVK